MSSPNIETLLQVGAPPRGVDGGPRHAGRAPFEPALRQAFVAERRRPAAKSLAADPPPAAAPPATDDESNDAGETLAASDDAIESDADEDSADDAVETAEVAQDAMEISADAAAATVGVAATTDGAFFPPDAPAIEIETVDGSLVNNAAEPPTAGDGDQFNADDPPQLSTELEFGETLAATPQLSDHLAAAKEGSGEPNADLTTRPRRDASASASTTPEGAERSLEGQTRSDSIIELDVDELQTAAPAPIPCGAQQNSEAALHARDDLPQGDDAHRKERRLLAPPAATESPTPTADNAPILAGPTDELGSAVDAVADEIALKPSPAEAPALASTATRGAAPPDRLFGGRAAPGASSPAGGADDAAGQIDRGRFLGRVESAIRTAQQRDGRVQVRLSPPELGSLRIELSIQHGVLAARLEAETATARNVLLDNLPALRERLAQQDIRVERFDVDVRADAGGNGHGNGAQQEQAAAEPAWRQEQGRQRRHATRETVASRVPRLAAQTVSDAALDVRV
jgi:flagellar hook-length control protein FliK